MWDKIRKAATIVFVFAVWGIVLAGIYSGCQNELQRKRTAAPAPGQEGSGN